MSVKVMPRKIHVREALRTGVKLIKKKKKNIVLKKSLLILTRVGLKNPAKYF